MKRNSLPLSLAAALLGAQSANAATTLSLSSADFQIGLTTNSNVITSFQFDIVLSDDVVPGGTYTNPSLLTIDYQVFGSLPDPTPSGFPAFALIRSIPGALFYSLSPEATVNFSVSSTADLSDGLQVNELAGSGTVFTFNARELNQAPGRYHPPILTLADDGTGTLANSNNMSTIPNPDPPIGSGNIVDVDVGEEYDNTLTFFTDLTIATVPEPSSISLIAAAMIGCVLRRRRD